MGTCLRIRRLRGAFAVADSRMWTWLRASRFNDLGGVTVILLVSGLRTVELCVGVWAFVEFWPVLGSRL